METFRKFVDMECNIDDDASIVFGWNYRYFFILPDSLKRVVTNISVKPPGISGLNIPR